MTADTPRYARSPDGTDLAYRVSGRDEPDLLCLLGMLTHLDQFTDELIVVNWLDRLERLARVILFDERGMGMSDPLAAGDSPTLQRRLEDLLAVLEAAGSRRVHVWAQGHAAPLAVMLAATCPERVASLAIYGGYARWFRDEDYPAGFRVDRKEEYLAVAESFWGTGQTLTVLAPGVSHDPGIVARWARGERMGASRRRAVSFLDAWMDSDVRPALSRVQAPTLVIHRRHDQYIPVQHGRLLAEGIPGSQYIELDGENHFPFGVEADELAGLLRTFMATPAEHEWRGRVMATVLFTDIVGSTEKVTELGDGVWSRLMERHDEMTRRQIERFGGRALKGTGDGYLATFELPGQAVVCARAICDGARQLGLEVRAGVHAGELEVRGDDVTGVAVHVASRICSKAGGSEVAVSRTVVDLVAGSELEFEDLGRHVLKGFDNEWELHRLAGDGG